MKNVLIIVGSDKLEAKELLKKLELYLKKLNISVSFFRYMGGAHLAEPSGMYDFVISLGGDGTVLFAGRYCAPRGIPIFPINFGKFGFIANIEPENWKPELKKILDGTMPLSERHLLSATVAKEKSCKNTCTALNDLVVSGSGIAKLINLDIFFNGISFGTFRADGIIISTPTGSTAYSAGMGGPILAPEVPAFILTPIAPFSLSNRPIVLPSDGKLDIIVLPAREKEILLSIDGQDLFSLKEGDKITITESEKTLKMAGCSPENFYKALRSKLGWSGCRI